MIGFILSVQDCMADSDDLVPVPMNSEIRYRAGFIINQSYLSLITSPSVEVTFRASLADQLATIMQIHLNRVVSLEVSDTVHATIAVELEVSDEGTESGSPTEAFGILGDRIATNKLNIYWKGVQLNTVSTSFYAKTGGDKIAYSIRFRIAEAYASLVPQYSDKILLIASLKVQMAALMGIQAERVESLTIIPGDATGSSTECSFDIIDSGDEDIPAKTALETLQGKIVSGSSHLTAPDGHKLVLDMSSIEITSGSGSVFASYFTVLAVMLISIHFI